MKKQVMMKVDQHLLDLLQKLPGEVRIFGSSLRGGPVADIDVAAMDKTCFAALLHLSQKLTPEIKIHPVLLDFDVALLHMRLSWLNCCRTMDAYGNIYTSPRFINNSILKFNNESKKYFNMASTVLESARKLVDRGFELPYEERMRVMLTLGHNDEIILRRLAHFLESAVSPQVLFRLKTANACIAGGVFRDMIEGIDPKDVDIFVPGDTEKWEELCLHLLEDGCQEIRFEVPEGKRVNLRKFRDINGMLLDVIQYGFVTKPEHVTETFDFTINQLWYNPVSRGVEGATNRTGNEIISDIRHKRLVVGDNLWYRAGAGRALKRWERFRNEGYTADQENIQKYQSYIKMMME